MKSCRRKPRGRPAAIVSALLLAPAAQAATVNLGDGYTLDYVANLTYSAAVRVDDPAPEILANVNGDDATRNFDKGALINNRLALLAEVGFNAGWYGAFVRGSAFYDDAYFHTNDNDSPATVNKTGRNDKFSDEAEEFLGARARLLDAYAYTRWSLGGSAFDLRVGSQVVAWGESLFFPNMNGAQGPVDATKSNVAGTEVKDILLPENQVLLQWGLNDRISFAGYYQFNWKGTELVPVGGYFSQSDVTGPGASFLIVPLGPDTSINVPRGADITPSDHGQWGISSKIQIGSGTELGLYHIRYHDRNPTGAITNFTPPVPLPSSYQVVFVEDIKMSAISVGTQLFGIAVGSELSYREGAGMNIDVVAGGRTTATPGRGDVVQGNVNFTKLILPTQFWDTLTLLGEASYLRVTDVEAIAGNDDVTNGREAAAYQALAQFGYKRVLPGWDLTLSAIYAHLFKGKSAVGGAMGSLTGEGDRRYTAGVGMKYLQNLDLQLAYNGYGGTPSADRTLADRSYVSFSAKYSF